MIVNHVQFAHESLDIRSASHFGLYCDVCAATPLLQEHPFIDGREKFVEFESVSFPINRKTKFH